MIPIGQREIFRLVLSYHERASDELRRWETLRSQSKLDRTNYDQVRAKYAAHERDAHRWVKVLRASAQRDLAPVQSELRQKQRAQRKLVEAVTAGAIDARAANLQNRTLAAEIAELSERAIDLGDIVSAKSTASLGGAIDLPLEEYASRFNVGDLQQPPRRPMTPLEKNLAAGIVMFTLVLGTVAGLAVLRSTVSAEFSASRRDIRDGFVRLECRNTGNRPIAFYVPWPNAQAHVPLGGESPKRSFGVSIFVRESESGEYRIFEGANGVFKYRGRQLEEGTPIEVAPQTTAAVYLDLGALREQGLDADALAIEFSRSGGGDRTRNEIQTGP